MSQQQCELFKVSIEPIEQECLEVTIQPFGQKEMDPCEDGQKEMDPCEDLQQDQACAQDSNQITFEQLMELMEDIDRKHGYNRYA